MGGGGGGRGMRGPNHNFVIALMITKFGTGIDIEL